MDKAFLENLLKGIAAGTTGVDDGIRMLKDFPYAEIPSAKLDTQRQLRRGFPETILAEGKTDEYLDEIVGKAIQLGGNVLITRTSASQRRRFQETFPDAGYREFFPSSAVAFVQTPIPSSGRGKVVIVTAGTSDIPVAREAGATLEMLGHEVVEVVDAGVAGIHRILAQRALLDEAEVVVVVAGMDGALPSVVAGLVHCPVIAVPTSVGYGASFGGVAALLTMLNACASGVVVVNIDNGFGAGMAAAMMNRRCPTHTESPS